MPAAGMNHYVPVLPKDSVKPEVLQEMEQAFKKELDEVRVGLSKVEMDPDLESKLPTFEDVAKRQSLYESLQLREKQLKHFQEIQSILDLKGLFAIEVPADGNCGAYSLRILEEMGTTIPPESEVFELRLKIADCWRKAAETERWRDIFVNFTHIFDQMFNDEASDAGEVLTPTHKHKETGLAFKRRGWL